MVRVLLNLPQIPRPDDAAEEQPEDDVRHRVRCQAVGDRASTVEIAQHVAVPNINNAPNGERPTA